MTRTPEEPLGDDLAFITGGPSHRLAQRLGMTRPGKRVRMLKVGLLLLSTWFPLALLSFFSGHAFGRRVDIPFLYDPEVQARFLVVVPLLELSVTLVAASLAMQMKQLVEIGIVPKDEQGRFQAAKNDAIQLRESWWPEGLILVLAIVTALVSRLVLNFSAGDPSWERVGGTVTPAGWWYMIVSLPVLYFLLMRWFWVFLVWSWFLYKISKLDLELTATHPDRTGGLGFVGWGLASFAGVLIAVSTVVSAAFADEILHKGASLDSLKYHVAVYIVVALAVLHAPMFAFSGKLMRCRFNGMLEFGALAWRHDKAFDEKWLKTPTSENGPSILGSADVQSLAGIATCYEHVNRMWLIPFDASALVILILAAALPMLPLLGTAIPLKEIFLKLAEMMV